MYFDILANELIIVNFNTHLNLWIMKAGILMGIAMMILLTGISLYTAYRILQVNFLCKIGLDDGTKSYTLYI